MKVRKPEVIAYLRAVARTSQDVPLHCVGALVSSDGGLYLPCGPRLTPELLAEWQRELRDVVTELARLGDGRIAITTTS